MTRFFKSIAIAGLLALSAIPAQAASLSPVGSWEVTTGEARYRVMYCGAKGDQLCAKLIWLRADARTAENLASLNKLVVKGAEATKENKWAGEVVFEGNSYDGTVTMVSKNYMKLNGCAGILCQTYEFTRI